MAFPEGKASKTAQAFPLGWSIENTRRFPKPVQNGEMRSEGRPSHSIDPWPAVPRVQQGVMASPITSEMVARSPAPAVSAYANGYGGFTEHVGSAVRRLDPARPHTTVIIAFCGKVTVGRIGDAGCGLDAFVTCAGGGPLLSSHDGRLQCVEIDFAPWASTVLLGASVVPKDGPVALADLLGRDADTLIERLAAAPNWGERFVLLDALFSARIARSNHLPRREVRWAWDQLERSAGTMPIRALSRAIGWSDRHFASCFRDGTGMSPKTAARMVEGDGITLADTAAACGYSDQSHFTREFGAFVGCTPAAYRAARFTDLPGTPASVLEA